MKYVLGLLAFVLVQGSVYSQGCSDAGFCSMGAMRPSQVYTKKINFKLRALEFSYYKGETELTPTINAATLDFTFGINEKTNLQFKLPYQWVDGSLGNTAGVADLSLSLTRNMYSTEKFHINGTLGFKIPTNNGDLDEELNSENLTDGVQTADLPMYYQTSLGTFDLVLGGAFISKEWMFAAGIQTPIAHNNENDFQYDQWQNYPDPAYLRDYDLATNLERGTDVMLRVERAFHFSNLDIRAGLLPIFRISKDEILDRDSGERIKLEGTTGMALTGLLNVAYHFNTKHTTRLLYGLKITDRDVNPDGLTRDNVLSLSYVLTF
ncbi:hypothetical protein E1176_18380 [Fulvivirga sp. RKSG066]|uniref:hypothetical protein n=1 Tax=Fulvivirga aurantia TaxID=2529383 RepID=UPI0012BCFC40|nr:hypothetical protein [Fulvivirga aurantia]MTI23004.1 hypothetical protein [Fulvivirga aurantia]